MKRPAVGRRGTVHAIAATLFALGIIAMGGFLLRRRRMERALARPHEVPGVGLLDLGIAGLGESESLLRPLAPARVCRDGGYELEVMGVKPEDPQEPGQASEVAIDDGLQVRHSSPAPVLDPRRIEHSHGDQDVDGSHYLAVRQ